MIPQTDETDKNCFKNLPDVKTGNELWYGGLNRFRIYSCTLANPIFLMLEAPAWSIVVAPHKQKKWR